MKDWKVGDLARATGLTVRALHHYDAVGLLAPSRRTGAGYRVYSEGDVERLQRIVSLRSLGLSLEEVRECLDGQRYTLERVVELHRERLREQIRAQQAAYGRLEALAARLRAAEEVSVEDLIQTIEAITMFEKYYTKEQLEELEARRQQVGEERIQQVQQEWAVLMAEVREEVAKGTDPRGERGRELAARWQSLIDEFTGGNPGIEGSLRRMYEAEPGMRERAGGDPAMYEFISKASGP